MGGLGSGNSNGRPAAESLCSLDINRLNREGMLHGFHGGLSWNNGGSVTLGIQDNLLTASGTLNGEPWKQSCGITWTPCHFGGTRPWFRCPYCSRRSGKMYIADSGLGCRKCYRLNNASTREDGVGRTWRRIRKLESKIIDGDVIDGDGAYHKPKGMHWRTFNRICDELEGLEERKNELFIIGAKRILGW